MHKSLVWLGLLMANGAGTAFAGDILGGARFLAPLDLTFYVVADTHADPQESYDLRAMARVINAVGRGGTWPTSINGQNTDFVGGAIAEPKGVVFLGDLSGWGVAPAELTTFQRYFQAGASVESIRYPAYIGLGNHDVDDADRPPALSSEYRQAFWNYVDSRHSGPNAPVPVSNFDSASHSYSWDFDRVHLIQAHRFPGDQGHGLSSSVKFLGDDLQNHASDGRPVFMFHHYGMDEFGSEARWWSETDRATYRSTINGFNIAGIFAGHSHFATQYNWEGKQVFQVNNAKGEINSGNNDGQGSFAIVRITDNRLDIVTCRWLDDAGHFELIQPFYSGDIQTQ